MKERGRKGRYGRGRAQKRDWSQKGGFGVPSLPEMWLPPGIVGWLCYSPAPGPALGR